MVRAPRYGYQYFNTKIPPIWRERETLNPFNQFYRKDLTGGDDEISLEDAEGGKPPTYVPAIDQQPLGATDVLGPRNPFQQASVRAPRYAYEDPIQRWQRSLIWQEPERIDDASDYYRRDEQRTLEDIAKPPTFSRRIDQRQLRPKDIPSDMLERDPFQQAGIKIETDADRAARRAAQQADWEEYQRQQAGGPPAPLDMVRQPSPEMGSRPAQQDTQSVSDIFGGDAGPVSPQSAQSVADAFGSGPPSPFAGISISDRVRGNRYANMSKRDRDALNLTIAGEIDKRYSPYGEPETDQEIANMVSTITNRAAQTGETIEEIVYAPSQYNALDPDKIGRSRQLLEENGPDIRRAVSNAITGEVMPTHQELTSYRNPEAATAPEWGKPPITRVGPHDFYQNVAPWSSAGRPLPAAPVDREVTSQLLPLVAGRPETLAGPGDLRPPPPFAEDRATRAPRMPSMSAQQAGQATPLYDGPPSPLSSLPASVQENIGVMPAPLTAPQPLTPEQVAAGQQRVNEMLDPALDAARDVPPALQSPLGTEAAPLTTPGERLQTGLATPQDPALQQALGPPSPLAALAEDRATRERALQRPPAPPTSPAPMPGVDMGQTPPLVGNERPAPVQSEIVPPPLSPLVDQTLAVGLKPRGIVLGNEQFGPAPPVPPVTPRQTVTPQTPVSPEEEAAPAVQAPAPPSVLPPLPPAVNVPTPIVTPAAPLQQESIDQPDGPRTGLEGYGQYQGPTARSRNPGFFGRFDRTHFVGGPGLTGPLDPSQAGGEYYKGASKVRGDFKAPVGTRTSKRVGGWLGGTAGFVAGGIPGAVLGNRLGTGAGWLLGRLGIFDPNRGPFDSRRKRDKDEDEDETKAKIIDKIASTDPGGALGKGGIAGSGLGSDTRVGGLFGGGYGSGNYGYSGNYPGYGGYGGGYGGDSVGGAYKNR